MSAASAGIISEIQMSETGAEITIYGHDRVSDLELRMPLFEEDHEELILILADPNQTDEIRPYSNRKFSHCPTQMSCCFDEHQPAISEL